MSGKSAKPSALIQAPAGYTDWLAELKAQIHEAQQRAAQSVNLELVLLYWNIGHAMGIAEYKLLESLPPELQTSLPSIEQIERELAGNDISMEEDAE